MKKRFGPMTQKRWQWVLTMVYAILLPAGLYQYLEWRSAGFVTGVIGLFLTPVYGGRPRRAWRYGVVALLFLLLYVLLPVKSWIYFGLAAAVLFFFETVKGRVAPSTVFIVLLMTPLIGYVLNVYSFPIRLQLTDAAAKMLRVTGMSVQAEGNILRLGGGEFSVDPACMGLHMLVVSLLAGLLLVNVYQKRQRKWLPALPVLGVLVMLLLLNIIMNIFRIMILVLFQILPDQPMHSFAGVFCLLVYVLLPAMQIGRYAVRRFGREMPAITPALSEQPVGGGLRTVHLLLAMALLGVTGWQWTRKSQPVSALAPAAVCGGYTVKGLGEHVLQLSNDHSLVYLKFIRSYYSTDHQPTICWRGSGYAFEQVDTAVIAGQPVYKARLRRGQELLYTAWWYDNGEHRSIDQLDWRWDLARGAKTYALVNVTAADSHELEGIVAEAIVKNSFRQLLQKGY